MAKRSSRRKRKEQARKIEARLTAPVLTHQGKTAFGQANYSEAIDAWEKAHHKPNVAANLSAALAEAYFRRALSAPVPSLDDLQQAVKLAPTDPRYIYHLALSHHRLDQPEQAKSLYSRLLALSPPFRRAAFPLAQLLGAEGQEITTNPVWSHLNEEEQNWLSAAIALKQNQPVDALRYISPGQSGHLWRALAAFALGETATARQDFEMVLAMPDLHPSVRGVAGYYLGVLAAQADQTELAMSHWQNAHRNNLNTPHLRQNLAVLLCQQAIAEQQAGHPVQALNLLEQSRKLSDNTAAELANLRLRLHLEAGYADSQQGRWAEALSHWQAVQEAGDTSQGLIINMAVAHDHLGQFRQAAELWREALRRRPRSATHPEAFSDEQVARLWQHIAENYRKAGDHKEAITTYRSALKWTPDNIDLQLALVDILQAEGNWQAADNELNRILKKHRDHVPALIRQAESYEADDNLKKARQIWQKVLQIEPDNSVARPQLAHLYETEGIRYANEGKYKKALSIVQEGLKHVPDSPMLHAYAGALYLDLRQVNKAHPSFVQALAFDSNRLSVLQFILLTWLDHKDLNEVDKTLDIIRALEPAAPASFLLEQVEHLSGQDLDTRLWGLLEFTEQTYPNDSQVLLEIAWRFYDDDQNAKAIGYLKRILRDDPHHVEANLRLGTIYYLTNQQRLARQHWKSAERQARQEDNEGLLYELRITKDALMRGIPPPPRGLGDLLDNMPPELAGFLDQFDNRKK